MAENAKSANNVYEQDNQYIEQQVVVGKSMMAILEYIKLNNSKFGSCKIISLINMNSNDIADNLMQSESSKKELSDNSESVQPKGQLVIPSYTKIPRQNINSQDLFVRCDVAKLKEYKTISPDIEFSANNDEHLAHPICFEPFLLISRQRLEQSFTNFKRDRNFNELLFEICQTEIKIDYYHFKRNKMQ